MAKLVWDDAGNKTFEAGVEQGVLYVRDNSGAYPTGVAWNGLISVSESPTGGEPQPSYADNIKYLNLMSTEEFEATIEAYTYPVEFEECDGSAEGTAGVKLGQQGRSTFGLAYKTFIGNDTEDLDHGYKLHLVYGCLAGPSEKSYETINDSPEAITFSWDITTTPEQVTGFKPTSVITIDSRTANETDLATLEDSLFGTEAGDDASLPLPDEVISIMSTTAI